MSLVVNNNLMAANVARNLNAHYGRLQTSTQRLSSGLRINSAADDAAGLAIRELQRADIAALQQGARNANDAISMIQVADGSLGIIDEKLIRMKELAEQAATGTYDSTQRLMIESEYQAMASEITRIANSTDFNGTKLLDGTLDGDHDGSGLTATGKMKIHFGTGNDSAEDYYYITIGECTAQAFGVGNASTWEDVQSRAVKAFEESLKSQIKNSTTLTDADKGKLLGILHEKTDADGNITAGLIEYVDKVIGASTKPGNAYDNWTATDNFDPDDPSSYDIDGDEGFLKDGKIWNSNASTLNEFLATAGDQDGTGTESADNEASAYFASLRETQQQKLKYAFGQAAIYTLANGGSEDDPFAGFDKLTLDKPPLEPTEYDGYTIDGAINGITFESTNGDEEAKDIIAKALQDAYEKVKDMDFAGHTIETQEDAQQALDAINNAIVSKDKIRAHLGATQNRLENTVTNLNIQAENLQAAESRISDVDVATEMTQFVRNQILTQSAVAMLGQANSLPQMAMQLIGG